MICPAARIYHNGPGAARTASGTLQETSVYNILLQLLRPFPWLVVGVGIGLWVAGRGSPGPHRWRRLAWAVYVLLVLDCLPVTAYYVAGLLEWQFEHRNSRPQETRVIVVLGGGAKWVDDDRHHGRLDEGSLYRIQRAAELCREGPRCPVVITGGIATRDVAAPATLMGEFLTASGVDSADIIIETDSRNTEENARFTAEILRKHGWNDGVVLITSATHLPRSVALFRRERVEVIPVGCAYHTDEAQRGVWKFWPSPSAASSNQEVVHELLGMAWLWLRGKL
jgi:uncharacterized SAM-binding protein YcdF (DUF218 family)